MRRRRPIGREELHKQRYLQAQYMDPISKEHPQVRSVSIQLECMSEGGGEVLRTSEWWDVPLTTHKMQFFEECHMRECVEGGYDLTPAVSKAIRQKLESDEGELTCHGWQDEERLGQYHCFAHLRYRIKIGYADRDDEVAT